MVRGKVNRRAATSRIGRLPLTSEEIAVLQSREVAVCASAVGGLAPRSSLWRFRQRRSRGTYYEPFFLKVGVLFGLVTHSKKIKK